MPTVEKHAHARSTRQRTHALALTLAALLLTSALASDWAPRLSGEHGMDLAPCPFTFATRPEPARVVLQVIQNTFHKWEEHDLPDGGTCLVQIEPQTRTLTALDAEGLLQASSAWIHQTITPPQGSSALELERHDFATQETERIPPMPMPTYDPRDFDEDDPRLREPDRPGSTRRLSSALPAPSWLHQSTVLDSNSGDFAATSVDPLSDSTDNPRLITDTVSHPYAGVGFLISHYNHREKPVKPANTVWSGRCTAFLVNAHTALTNSHCIVLSDQEVADKTAGLEVGDRASSISFIPAANPYPSDPFGTYYATENTASQDYLDALAGSGNPFNFDYASVHFNQSFSKLGIATYVPVVFTYGENIFTTPPLFVTGYPGKDPQGSDSTSMWQTVTGWTIVWPRRYSYYAYNAGGQSGSPLWTTSGDLRVTGLHAYGFKFLDGSMDPNSGGPRLVNANQSLIEGWMLWQPDPQPANDDWQNATGISGSSGTLSSSNVGATRQLDEPLQCGNQAHTSIWWAWVAPTTGTATFSLAADDGGEPFIAHLSVFEGPEVSRFERSLACERVIPESILGVPPRQVRAEVTSGTQYLIAVDGIGVAGAINLAWQLATPGAAPLVSSFSASPASIVEGSPSTLSWSVSGSEPISVFVSGGVGDVSGSGSVVVYPAVTTTYTLTASNAYGSDSRQVTVNVTPDSGGGGDGLIARITSNPVGQARVNQVVTLDGTASTFGDGSRSVYEFDSGDGRIRQESWGEWIMNYPAAGSYQPCVRVRNTLNQWSPWACTSINIVNEAASGPDLTILSYETEGFVGPSNPPYVGIDHGDSFGITVNWWNDGTALPADHPRFYLQLLNGDDVLKSKDYSAPAPPGDGRRFTDVGSALEPGEYTLVITIDSRNAIQETNELNNSRSFTLEVYSLPPVADFSVSSSCLTASFTDASSHPMGTSNIIRRTWDFGDGNTSTLQSPVHTYASAGSYSVRLTVEDKWGNPDTHSGSVTVQECQEPIGPPTIGAIWSNPEAITVGENAFLSWVVSGTQPITLTLDQGIGDVSGLSNASVSPTETTTYTLTATNEAGTTSASTTVTLYQVLPPDETPIATMRLLPLASDCGASSIGQACSLTITTSDTDPSEAFAAAQFMVLSSAFSVQGVTPAGIAEGCLASAGPETIAIICDQTPINADGVIAEVTLQREAAGDATIDVLDVWLYDPDGIQYAAAGGSLEVLEATVTPNPPMSLSATAVSHERIDLSWAPAEGGADAYRIEYGTGDCTGAFAVLTDVPASTTSYAHTGLAANMQYCYRIRTLLGDQSSASSNASSATTLTAPTTDARVVPVSSDCGAAAPGEACSVWVQLIDNTDQLGGVEFQFTAPLFSLTQAQASGIASTCLASTGPSIVGLICEPAFTGNGEILRLTTTRAEAGDSTFVIGSVNLIDPSGNTMPTAGGELFVPEFTCDIARYADHPLGDFNADGTVSTPDALLILRTAVASLPAPEPGGHQSYHADLNSDGLITTADALLALQKAVDPTRPARLAVAPRSLTLDQGKSACVLVGNAGSQPLPDLTITTPTGVSVTDMTHDGAIGRVLRVTRDTGSGTTTIDAGTAGNLTIQINP